MEVYLSLCFECKKYYKRKELQTVWKDKTLIFLGIDKIHLIGHSLGAHVVGFMGKKYEELTGEKIPRITGQ